VTAAGGVLLLATLWLTWGYDRAVAPAAPLTAWEAMPFAAALVAGAAGLVLASAVVTDGRRGALLAAAAGILAAIAVVAALVVAAPGPGARVTLLVALLVVAVAGWRAIAALPGTPAERWRSVPRAALARIALGAGAMLVVAALWAPWGSVDAWERFSRTDVLQCLLGVVMLAAAVAGRRSGAIVAAGVSLLVGAGAARQLSGAEVPAGVQLTLLGAAIGVVAAAVLVVETLEGDPVERWRRLGPGPLLRVVTAFGALALLAPLTTWRASPPLPAILAVLAVAGLVSAALRSPRRAATVGVAAGGVALVALVVAHSDTGFGPAVLFGVLAAVSIALGALARLAEGWHDLGHSALAVGRSSALWAALVTVSVYPLSASVEPGAKLDESWIAALYLAAGRGLDYGTEIVFTYGPLGYLTVPRIISPGMFAAAIAYVIAAYAAAAYAIVATARRTLGLVAAVLIAVFTLSGFRIVATEDTVQVATASAALLAVAALLQADSLRRSRWWWWIVAAAGVLAAFHALIRLNVGLLVVLLAALAIVAGAAPGRRLRSAGLLGATFGAALVVLWTALGQDLGTLRDYVLRSYEVVKGYSEAMGYEEGARSSDYVVAAFVTVALLGVAVWSARRLGRCRGGALVAAIALFEYSWFKQGFVRHEPAHHVLMFFGVAIPAALAAARPPARWPVIATVLIAAGAWAFVARSGLDGFTGAGTSWASYRELPAVLRSADARLPQLRQDVRNQEALDAETLRLLQGHTVHIAPSETVVAWAYPELRWHPLPTLQHYLGYTPALDRLNVDALADSRRAPERILRSVPELRLSESPAATLALLCRYREQYATERWQVLMRVPNRCGKLTPAGSVRAASGARVPVPAVAPQEALLFSVDGLEIGPLEQIRSLLWKPRPRYLIIEGSASQIGAAMATTPTLVRVGEAADYAGAPLDTGAVQVGGSITTDGVTGAAKGIAVPTTVRFYRVRVD